jgi:hypothetical protein
MVVRNKSEELDLARGSEIKNNIAAGFGLNKLATTLFFETGFC